MRISKQTVPQASVILSVAALSGGLLGYVREGLVAFYFGPGPQLDAYLMAFLIPTFFMNFFNVSLPYIFINLLNKIRAQAGEEAGWGFALRTLKWLAVILTSATLVCLAASGPLLGLFAVGFTAAQRDLAAMYLVWLSPVIMAAGLYFYATAILQSYRHYVWPAVSGLLINIFPVTFMLILGRALGLKSLALGMMAGYACQCAFLLILMARFKQGTAAGPRVKMDRDDWQTLVFPIAAFIVLDQCNLAAVRSLASTLEKGAVSMVYFATVVLQLVQMVFTLPICRALYPDLTQALAQGRTGVLQDKVMAAVKVYLSITLPVVAGILVLHRDIIQLLFERGAFTAHHTQTTATVFMVCALSMLPVGLANVFTIVFFSLRKIWDVILSLLLLLACTIALSLWWMPLWGVVGLALANLAANVAAFVWVFVAFQVRVMRLTWRRLYLPVLQTFGLAAAMALILWAGRNGFPPAHSLWPASLRLSSVAFLGMLFYLAMGYGLQVGEIVYLIDKMKTILTGGIRDDAGR